MKINEGILKQYNEIAELLLVIANKPDLFLKVERADGRSARVTGVRVVLLFTKDGTESQHVEIKPHNSPFTMVMADMVFGVHQRAAIAKTEGR